MASGRGLERVVWASCVSARARPDCETRCSLPQLPIDPPENIATCPFAQFLSATICSVSTAWGFCEALLGFVILREACRRRRVLTSLQAVSNPYFPAVSEPSLADAFGEDDDVAPGSEGSSEEGAER